MLNLYAGIGGNRKLWKDVDVTAVEINSDIAKIYQEFFPDDKVIVGDAHEYLLKHFKEFDFIWSSPPCPTHSKMKLFCKSNNKQMGNENREPEYIDFKLYQEIILLNHFANGNKWVIENVKSYYKPLIKPILIDRHYFWSNFHIAYIETEYGGDIRQGHCKELSKVKDVNIDNYKIEGRRKDAVIRSYFSPILGKHIFDCAFKLVQKPLTYR